MFQSVEPGADEAPVQADPVFEPTCRVTRCYEDVAARPVLLDPFGAAPGFSAPRTSPRGTTPDAFSA